MPWHSVDWIGPPLLYRVLVILVLLVAPGCTNLKRWLYEGFGRDSWQHRDQVVESLRVKPGDRVADLGSGSGYFTFPFAAAVGEAGKVYAVDIDPGMNEYVASQAKKLNADNIEAILAKEDDPMLPVKGIDLVFTCNTYHHLPDRIGYFRKLKQSLRADARVAVIDFNGDWWLVRWIGHWTAKDIILQELQAAGYVLEQDLTLLPKQTFLVFSAGEMAEPPRNR